jgi:hypothetical protein
MIAARKVDHMKRIFVVVVLGMLATGMVFPEQENGITPVYIAWKAGWGQDYGDSFGAGIDFRNGLFGLLFGFGFDTSWGYFIPTWSTGVKLHLSKDSFSSAWISAGVSDVSLIENVAKIFQVDTAYAMLGYSMLFKGGLYIDIGAGFSIAIVDTPVWLPITGTISVGFQRYRRTD